MDTEQTQVSIDKGDAGAGSSYQPLDRFNAFSDGVFAIVITLLVLELPVPPDGAPVLPALAESWSDFLGYAISFAFVGGIWLSHAGLTKSMKRGDDVSFRLNLVMLLFVSLLPFTTKLMVAHIGGAEARSAVTLYGANLLVASLMLSGLLAYVARDRQLVVDGLADDRIRQAYHQRKVYLVLSAVAILVGIVAPSVAVGFYVVLTVAFIIQPLMQVRRSH